MRDVTDNVTGELEVTVKRGRGRPRKEGALTNAQRQAAYRARRRESVTVTKNAPVSRLVVDQVDAYDECRLEVEQLRAELAEAHETIDEMTVEMQALRTFRDKACDAGSQLAAVRGQLDLAEAERSKAFAYVDNLQAELAAAKKVAAKSVTSAGNGYQAAYGLAVQLLEIACNRKTLAGRKLLYESAPWKGVHRLGLSEDVFSRLSDAVFGPSEEKTVTRKAVTKK